MEPISPTSIKQTDMGHYSPRNCGPIQTAERSLCKPVLESGKPASLPPTTGALCRPKTAPRHSTFRSALRGLNIPVTTPADDWFYHSLHQVARNPLMDVDGGGWAPDPRC